MDQFSKRLQEERDFWRTQIGLAESRGDYAVLPRLRDALMFVEFKIDRYRRAERPSVETAVKIRYE